MTVEFTPSSTGGTGADAYSSVAITIDGERHVLTPESANTATNASGDKALGFGASLNGGADTREMLFVTYIEGAFQSEQVGMFILGNETPAGALPSATATYTGGSLALEASDPTSPNSGNVTIAVDFDNGNVTSGTITFDSGDLSGTTLTLAPTAIAGTGFDTSLTSSGTPLTASALDGQFYGANGQELGGAFNFDNASGTFVGYYGATD